MADFHFLRPWWLLALPFGIALIFYLFRLGGSGGGWRNVVDRSLQPFVLTGPGAFTERRWPLTAALAIWILATLALAGPAWERLPVPAFRSDEALVVALDLSRSMDAADLKPSRIARAKLKLLSLLERREGGQIGLVVFSAHAFTVTPLTTDTRTIASLVGALTSDIMPSRGSYIEAGLDKAASLLRQTGVTEGEILIISDAEVSGQAIERARALRREGIVVHVLGVGTEEGAPIPEPDGGFYTDNAGRVVVPRLDAASLRRLADAGGGRFSMLTPDDRDLELLVEQQAGAVASGGAGSESDDYQADVWRDAGLWLALLLLPLVAFGFRRGWLAMLMCCFLLPLPPGEAQAQVRSPSPSAEAPAANQPPERAQGTEPPGTSFLRDRWQSLWLRPDQRGLQALEAEQPERAAELFEDPEWLATARYRAGDYTDSAAALSGLDTDDTHYNRGTALARAGQVESAIQAYDRALELNPDHEDARFNRDLLQELLDQNEEQQQSESDSGQQQDEQQASGDQSEDGEQSAEGGESDNSEGQQQAQDSPPNQEPGGEGQSDEENQSTADEGQNSDDPREGDPDQPGEEEREQRAAEAAESPGPEDIEQWASEQAAEQWLRRIPQDPGGLLRRKFLYQYQRLGIDQDGNYVWPGDEAEPW